MLKDLCKFLSENEDHHMMCVGDIKRMLDRECEYCANYKDYEMKNGEYGKSCCKWDCAFEPKEIRLPKGKCDKFKPGKADTAARREAFCLGRL